MGKKAVVIGPFSLRSSSKGKYSAAYNWTMNFIDVIASEYQEVVLISHEPMSLKRPGLTAEYVHYDSTRGIKQYEVSYLNLALIRKFHIGQKYLAVLKSLPDLKKTDIFFYNPTLIHFLVWFRMRNYCDMKFINIILDLSKFSLIFYPGIESFFQVDKHIFLSRYLFLRSKVYSKLNWVGSAYGKDCDCQKLSNEGLYVNKVVFVYTGKTDKYSNIDVIIDVFSSATVNCELYITGFLSQRLLGIINNTGKVFYKGYLSTIELSSLCASADFFISSQIDSHYSSKVNFPSKILHYASFCKPILCDPMPSISKELRECFVEPLDSSYRSWYDTVHEVTKNYLRDQEYYENKAIRLCNLLARDKQKAVLIDFLK